MFPYVNAISSLKFFIASSCYYFSIYKQNIDKLNILKKDIEERRRGWNNYYYSADYDDSVDDYIVWSGFGGNKIIDDEYLYKELYKKRFLKN